MVIGKHFTLDKSIPGNDHYHSMNPKDVIKILNSIKLIEQIKGKRFYYKQDRNKIKRKCQKIYCF